jgi:DNA-binding response OmpR family regulator
MATILVVEDEANVRKLVAVNLAQRGHRVLEAENGQQALDQLYDEEPALMVLDIKLPDLSGWDILDRLSTVSSLPADFPVLVMTASPVDQNTIFDQYPSVVEILIKPFSTDKLIAAVQRALLKGGEE